MSDKENGVSTGVVPTAAPTGTHAEVAQECVTAARAVRERIPNLVIPTSTRATVLLASAASVSPEFVELTNLAVANETTLVRGGAPTPAEVRDLVGYAAAFNPVADEYEALAHFIRHSCTAALNKAGSEALTTYALAQRLAKRPETAHLAPYVADMRRALRRGRKQSAEAAAQKAEADAQKAADAAAKAVEKAAKLAAKVPKTEPKA